MFSLPLVSHLKYLELLVNIDLMWMIAGHSHVALPDPCVANIVGVAISTVKVLSSEEMNNQFVGLEQASEYRFQSTGFST
jgi:hypothetical protein